MSNRKPIPKKTRFKVFMRDKFTCQYCGQSAPDVKLHLDHVKPVSKGGTNDIENLTTSCIDCNLSKSNKELTLATQIMIYLKNNNACNGEIAHKVSKMCNIHCIDEIGKYFNRKFFIKKNMVEYLNSNISVIFDQLSNLLRDYSYAKIMYAWSDVVICELNYEYSDYINPNVFLDTIDRVKDKLNNDETMSIMMKSILKSYDQE